MKCKIATVFTAIVFLASLLLVAPATASGPEIPSGLIPVDIDPYYKALTGEGARAKIEADLLSADPALLQAAASTTSSVDAAGEVGEVRVLYADGLREFTLRAIGGNAEIWVANDLSYCDGDDPRPPHVVTQEQIDYLFNEYNNTIYPSNSTYFGYNLDRDGSNALFAGWGLDYTTDNPQRMMILVYNIVDEGYCDPDYPFYVAGYFWALVNEVYADRNIIHIDSHDWANRIGAGVARPHLYEQIIAHEMEHAIHYDRDPDEPSWVDEGLADLSGYLAGYGHAAGHIAYYMMFHRTPLTAWLGCLEDYGESYLFQLYLLEQYGPAFTSALVADQDNGIAGIQNQLDIFDESVTFDDLYRDWTLANYLDDRSLTGHSGAPLGYETLDIPSVDTDGYTIQWGIDNTYGSDNHGNLPIPRYWGGYKSGTVQYPIGELTPYSPMYLTYKGYQPKLASAFRGDATTGISANSGDYQLWGGRVDLAFHTATTAAPVALAANASLSFWTYYETEEAWDFGFAQISTDGGVTWTSLANEHTRDDYDPQAHEDVIANVPGFTGHSEGWVQEVFDLAAYEGQDALFRFLYVTDWATVETGFYVDDVMIVDDTGTLLDDDLEAGDGNWSLDGWEYTTGQAENDWEITYINPIYQKGKFSEHEILDGAMSVGDEYQRNSEVLDTGNLNRDEVTIVVSNHLPEDTSFPASYRLLVKKGNAKK